MFSYLRKKVEKIPTPVAGLALGIASLGWCLENALPLRGEGQNAGALIAALLLASLSLRFVFHPRTLLQDLRHPVVGSIVPTFAMALMVISRALANVLPYAGPLLWLGAVGMHLTALLFFFYYRLREPGMHHMVPAWFVPPVGIIVADVTCPGDALVGFASILLAVGMASYLVMLPLMLYRFIFHSQVPDGAKPTIAIMAAPASLSLAGYLTVVKEPSLLVCAILLGVALLMTLVIYCAFFRLMRLPFSPGYAAFTFPLAIGATALYKTAHLVNGYPGGSGYAGQLQHLATLELVIATLVIAYVTIRFVHYYFIPTGLSADKTVAG